MGCVSVWYIVFARAGSNIALPLSLQASMTTWAGFWCSLHSVSQLCVNVSTVVTVHVFYLNYIDHDLESINSQTKITKIQNFGHGVCEHYNYLFRPYTKTSKRTPSASPPWHNFWGRAMSLEARVYITPNKNIDGYVQEVCL